MNNNMPKTLSRDNESLHFDARADANVTTVSSIPEHSQAVENLLNGEGLLNIITSSTQDAIIMLDDIGNITFWNKAAEMMFGYTREEIIGQKLHSMLPPMHFKEAQNRAFQLFRKTGTGAAVGKTVELAGLRKSGKEFPIELSLSAVQVKGAWHSIGIVRDISERKQAEELIKSTLEFQRVLMDAIPLPIFYKDTECIYRGCNKAYVLYMGLSPEQFIGKSVYDIAPPDLAESYDRSDRELLNNPGVQTYESSVVNAAGICHDVIFIKSTYNNSDGSVAGLIGVINDISEQQKSERSLLKAFDKIKSANSIAEAATLAKSDFLANMSHELRTPLNSFIGFSEVLQDQLFGPVNDKQHKYLNNILTSGRHILSLINKILDLSKLESGKMELDLNTFSLRELLDTSLMMFTEKAQKVGITLRMNVSPQADILIIADKRKFKQILFNLLSNAVKFTHANGRVNLDAVRAGNFIEITVADTGVGIKGEDIPKLFHPFTQLESAYTKRYEGTGLGLVLTRKLVELHGGNITVESQFGVGSKFSVTIPINTEA